MEQIDPKTLVLIDEAGMAATTDLAGAIDYVIARGGSVRLVGDDRQLASVAAGGVLRDIAHQVGAVTLTEVHRFRRTHTPRPPPPSPSATATRPRSRSTPTTAASTSATSAPAPTRPTPPGPPTAPPARHCILLAPTRDLVAELNTRARNDRLTADSRRAAEIAQRGAVTLADGTPGLRR